MVENSVACKQPQVLLVKFRVYTVVIFYLSMARKEMNLMGRMMMIRLIEDRF